MIEWPYGYNPDLISLWYDFFLFPFCCFHSALNLISAHSIYLVLSRLSAPSPLGRGGKYWGQQLSSVSHLKKRTVITLVTEGLSPRSGILLILGGVRISSLTFKCQNAQNRCLIACQSLFYSVVWTPIGIYHTCVLKIETIHTPISSPSSPPPPLPSIISPFSTHPSPSVSSPPPFTLIRHNYRTLNHTCAHTTVHDVHFVF